jgi:hypothetical protein
VASYDAKGWDTNMVDGDKLIEDVVELIDSIYDALKEQVANGTLTQEKADEIKKEVEILEEESKKTAEAKKTLEEEIAKVNGKDKKTKEEQESKMQTINLTAKGEIEKLNEIVEKNTLKLPEGDLFDAKGDFVKSYKGKHIVRIDLKNFDGIVLPSQLKGFGLTDVLSIELEESSNKIMNKIVNYYAEKLGLTTKFKFAVGSENDGSLSAESPGFTSKDNIARLNNNGGFSKDCDNYDNLKSIVVHENFHQIDNIKPAFNSTILNHSDVYIAQINDNSFKDVTIDFKWKIVASFANYLLNLEKRKDTEGEYFYRDREFVLKRINLFNEIMKGVFRIEPSSQPLVNRGYLDLVVIYLPTNEKRDATYKPLTNEKK